MRHHALCVSFLALGGCSLFAPSTESVAIVTNEPEAEIYVDGALVGKGTASVSLARNRSHGIMAKVGDRAGTATIGTTISVTGVLDIVGGFFFLIPFLGIAGPGFWSLDSKAVNVIIPPKTPG